jgi:DegT/DnrJ/EryC1/StrS aminotransferase family
MTVYGLEPAPKFPSDLFGGRVKDASSHDIMYVGSGKAAIALILSYLMETKVIPNKMAPLLVPEWIGTWVYAQMLNYGLPVVAPNPDAKVIFCYHQYGFPQDMDRVMKIANARGVIVIEDCAHAADSFYKGQKLGSIGDFALFSFSKFASCFALGGLQSEDIGFREFVKVRQQKYSHSLKLAINIFKFCDEMNNARQTRIAASRFDGARNMAYSRYGELVSPSERAIALWEKKREGELNARRSNYRELRALVASQGYCDHLDSEGVSPYAVPLFVPETKSKPLIAALNARGIRAGSYRFDLARCVFEPDFQPCVLVPIHSGMTGQGIALVAEALEAIL